MVIVMDMDTGKIEKLHAGHAAESAEEEFGPFVDEVLNAGWLPQPAARLEPHTHAVDAVKPALAVDADEFLNNLYRHQE